MIYRLAMRGDPGTSDGKSPAWTFGGLVTDPGIVALLAGIREAVLPRIPHPEIAPERASARKVSMQLQFALSSAGFVCVMGIVLLAGCSRQPAPVVTAVSPRAGTAADVSAGTTQAPGQTPAQSPQQNSTAQNTVPTSGGLASGSLDGIWSVVSGERGGQAISAETLNAGGFFPYLEISGRRVTVKVANIGFAEGTVATDTSRQPAELQMQLTIVRGRQGGKSGSIRGTTRLPAIR